MISSDIIFGRSKCRFFFKNKSWPTCLYNYSRSYTIGLLNHIFSDHSKSKNSEIKVDFHLECWDPLNTHYGCVWLASLCRPLSPSNELFERSLALSWWRHAPSRASSKWPVPQAGQALGADPGEPLEWRQSYAKVPGFDQGKLKTHRILEAHSLVHLL